MGRTTHPRTRRPPETSAHSEASTTTRSPDFAATASQLRCASDQHRRRRSCTDAIVLRSVAMEPPHPSTSTVTFGAGKQTAGTRADDTAHHTRARCWCGGRSGPAASSSAAGNDAARRRTSRYLRIQRTHPHRAEQRGDVVAHVPAVQRQHVRRTIELPGVPPQKGDRR